MLLKTLCIRSCLGPLSKWRVAFDHAERGMLQILTVTEGVKAGTDREDWRCSTVPAAAIVR